MKPIEDVLRDKFSYAIGLAFGAENAIDPLIKAADPKFADYQSNVTMPLSKRVGLPPREVAGAIIKHLELADMCDPPTIAGPGFINLKLKKEWLGAQLQTLAAEPRGAYRAGVSKVESPQTVAIDYSAPNVAKQMHIGHLRSTVIGDTLARTLEFLGHTVVRQNHIGDFGTQFGMLIHHLRDKHVTDADFTIADLDRWYKEATARFKAEKEFATIARKTVVDLQSGEPAAVALWNRMRAATHAHYTEIYKLLGVTLTDEHERGESFFGPRLAAVVAQIQQTLEVGGEGPYVSDRNGAVAKAWEFDADDLPAMDAAEAKAAIEQPDAANRVTDAAAPEKIERPFASVSNGAVCVFLPGYVTKDGSPLPFMLQKSDGGYPYAATDLAALHFRVQADKTTPAEQRPLARDWHASRVIYLVDSRQSQHFSMLFDTFRAARWDHLPDGTVASLEHAPFGTILGKDGKPFKTRTGESVELKGFLNEAIEAAAKAVKEKNPDLPADKQAAIARAVGIAAVKYADQRSDRLTDYIFNAEQMVAFEGNTGPYLMYAFTRVQAIFRKAGVAPESVASSTIHIAAPEEAALAKLLLRFPGVVESVGRDLKPHHLCGYLYDLATAYSSFYEACPVIQAPTPEIKASRLLLCDLVARTLHIGLHDLLGIQTLDEM